MIKFAIKVLWGTTVLTVLLALILSYLFPSFSPIARAYISLPVRSLLAAVASTTPLPLFELGAITVMLALPFLVWRFIKGRGSLSALVFALQLFLVGYALTEGIDLSAPAIENDTVPTDAEYIEALNTCVENLARIEPELDDNTTTDHSITAAAATRYARDNLGVRVMHIPRAKCSLFSSVLTKIGTLAYYPPISAEAILNGACPEFMQISSYSHELMHFFGVMRENEATYHSFLALSSSGDKRLEYVAYICAYVAIGARVYEISPDEYRRIEADVPPRVKKDLSERSRFLHDMGGVASDSQSVACLEELLGTSSYDDAARLITVYLSVQAV